MAENDHRGDPSEVNPEGELPPFDHPQKFLLLWFFQLVLDWLAQWFPVPPRLVPGTVVLRKDLVRNLQVSDNTVAKWIKEGLQAIPGVRSRSDVFLADDVIAFLRGLKERSAV